MCMHVWFKMCHGQNLDYLPIMGMVLLPLSGNHDHGQNLDFHGGMTIDHIYIYISIYKMFDHGIHVWSCMFNLHGFMCHTCTGLWFGEWVLGGSTADVPGMETAHPWQYPSFPPRQGPGSIPKSGWMSSFMFLCYKWQSKLTESHSANPLDAELLLVSI